MALFWLSDEASMAIEPHLPKWQSEDRPRRRRLSWIKLIAGSRVVVSLPARISWTWKINVLQFAKLIPVRTHAPLNFLSIRIKFGRADLTALGERVVRILLRRSRHRRQLLPLEANWRN